MTVTMYRNNRLHQAEQHDPALLAADFVSTLKGEQNPEYKKSGALNLEYEYRWFLSGLGGPNLDGFTWDDKDWAALWGALNFALDGLSEDGYSEVLRSLG